MASSSSSASASLSRLQQQLKLRGVAVQRDGLLLLAQWVARQGGMTEREALDCFMAGLDRLQVKSQIVSRSIIDDVITREEERRGGGRGRAGRSSREERNRPRGGEDDEDDDDEEEEEIETFEVIDAFDMPRTAYSSSRKQFFRPAEAPSLFAEPEAKARLYRERFEMLLARALRSKQYRRGMLQGEGEEEPAVKISPIQSLIGHPRDCCVAGVISQVEDGRFFLEDLNATIPLDLASASATQGLVTENSVVLARGQLLPSGVLKVVHLELPPLETREASLGLTDGYNFLGLAPINPKTYRRLLEREQHASEEMFVIISDVWIDIPEVLERLKAVLEGYDAVPTPPTAFIFIGNFFSKPYNLATSDIAHFKSCFEKLGRLIASHQRLRDKCKFVFVPGPGDPGPTSNVLPQPALPLFFSHLVSDQLPFATFASNPCRIRFFSQEIVIFRQDLQQRMRRACVVLPPEGRGNEYFEHLVVTVLHQSHLCPMPIALQPIAWDFDYTLRLFPCPHMLVLADSASQCDATHEGVRCCNPGPFSLDSSFMVYYPSSKTLEPCSL